MADVKISQLPAVTSPVASTDVLPVVQGGATKKASVAQLGFLPAGTSAVTRTIQDKLRDVVSVKDFGAVGNGVANDTTAIQNALNSGAKVVLFPAGNYVFTTLTIPQRVTLVGEGADVTYLSTSTAGDALLLNGERITIKQFTLQQTSGSKQGKGLVGSDKYWLTTEYVKVVGFDYGLYCDKAIYHSHKQSWFESCNYGCYYWGAAGAWNTDWFNNVITFDTCRFNANTNIGTYVKGCEVVFINPDWSGMSATNAIGLRVVGEGAGQLAHGIKVISPYAEVTDIVFSFLYAYVEIDGGFVQGGTASGASAFTSIIDADNSHVWWNGRMRDQDYWDNGYRLSNSSQLIFDSAFSGSVRASNAVDATSYVAIGNQGSFTATLTGCTTSPTVTARYVIDRGQVTVSIPANTATSNSTACTITGLPALLNPARDQIFAGAVFNDGVETIGMVRLASSGGVVLSNGAYGTAFLNSGTKGHREISLSYQLA